MIGRETLSALSTMLSSRVDKKPEVYDTTSVFRFGNGATETSAQAVRIPVGISQKLGLIDAAIIEGKAPLLLGRPTLERLNVVLNFRDKTMRFLDQTQAVPMHTNPAGQLLINVLDFPTDSQQAREARTHPQQHAPHVGTQGTLGSPEHPTRRKPVQGSVPDEPDLVKESVDVAEPRCVADDLAGATVADDLAGATHPQETAEAPVPKKKHKTKITLKQKECRCLLAQVKQQECRNDSQTAVAELFCSPCFAEKARAQGGTGLSFSVEQGCDLLDEQTQRDVSELLDAACPELLLACPPCVRSNRCLPTPVERARLVRTARQQVRFCVQEIHRQLKRGGQFLFEHELSSPVWKLPEVQSLKRRFGLHRIDMCAYGMCCPKSRLPVQKAAGIISSHPSVGELVRSCPGCPTHQVVVGSDSLRASANKFPPAFVEAVWTHLGPDTRPVKSDIDWVALGCECLAGEDEHAPAPAQQEPSPEQVHKVDQALKRLHANLGHPSSRELNRILKHSGASSLAVQRASLLQCSVCANHQRPAAPLPANSHRVQEFNDRIGLDIKHLPSWQTGQKVPCVNIVDYASSLQIMVPLFKRETGELIRSVVRHRWVAWAGPPKVLVLDPARPNLGEVLGEFCNNQGITVEQTATGSHWQLGKVERHGGWFQNILQRVLDDVRPTSEEEYMTCIVQTQSAKNSLLTEAGASPYQYVFGRNPRVPTDLLQDAPDLAASDAVTADPSCRQAHVVRQTARRAVLECQDDRALRAALRARPRVHREFQSGDWVYYWRTQKSVDGTRIEGGRWYGAAMVLGRVGRNLVVAHKRSIMRCSPEQLRPATDEESTVAAFPDNELLGIRVLLEKGQFPRSQFIDLVGQPEAPNPIESDSNPAATDTGHAMSAGQLFEGRHEAQIPALRPEARAESQQLPVGPYPSDPNPEDTALEGYGPVGRVPHKSKPHPVHRRPVEEHPEDFLEMMQEVVPRLLQELPPPGVSSEPSRSSGSVPEASTGPNERSPRGESTKREASREPGEVPVASRPRHHSIDEDLYVEGGDLGHLHSSSVECLLAAFMQKRMQKEIPSSGNPQELQSKVDAAKSLEWETIQGKTAMRVWKGAKAREIRRRFPNRFMGSRFVITNKVDEDGERVKARLCLQGHLDPDFHQKIASGDCHSPTLSGLGRALLLQLLVSNHWVMNLGDIKGRF